MMTKVSEDFNVIAVCAVFVTETALMKDLKDCKYDIKDLNIL
jgi:hypothetical protein